MMNVKTAVPGKMESVGAPTVRGKITGDELEFGVARSDEDRKGKEGSKERATVETEQRQDTAHEYVSGREDRSRWGHECCTVVCAVDATARKKLVKGCDERDCEANMVGEEQERKAENDRKRRHATTGTGKTTSDL